jgi:tripartite-type tricarboxylate transporter receptor subunit TctC
MTRTCAAVALAVALTLGPPEANADAYPMRPVKVIVPGPAGGGLDVVARTVAQNLTERGRGNFFVENRPGAGGTIGAGAAVNAAADGYTILVISQDFVIHPLIKSDVPYDPFKSFAPVALVVSAPETLLINPALPAHSMKELVAVLKESPGKYNYATPGYGTSPHLANERLFKLTLGTDVVHVPFQGAPPAIASTIAGDTQILHITLPLVAAHMKEGRLRALALASHKRDPAFPNLPTLAEAGIPGHEVGFWVGVTVRAGTPEPIVQWLHRQISEAVSQPEAKAKFATLGFELIASTPEEFGNHIKSESDRWSRVVNEARIRIN